MSFSQSSYNSNEQCNVEIKNSAYNVAKKWNKTDDKSDLINQVFLSINSIGPSYQLNDKCLDCFLDYLNNNQTDDLTKQILFIFLKLPEKNLSLIQINSIINVCHKLLKKSKYINLILEILFNLHKNYNPLNDNPLNDNINLSQNAGILLDILLYKYNENSDVINELKEAPLLIILILIKYPKYLKPYLGNKTYLGHFENIIIKILQQSKVIETSVKLKHIEFLTYFLKKNWPLQRNNIYSLVNTIIDCLEKDKKMDKNKLYSYLIHNINYLKNDIINCLDFNRIHNIILCHIGDYSIKKLAIITLSELTYYHMGHFYKEQLIAVSTSYRWILDNNLLPEFKYKIIRILINLGNILTIYKDLDEVIKITECYFNILETVWIKDIPEEILISCEKFVLLIINNEYLKSNPTIEQKVRYLLNRFNTMENKSNKIHYVIRLMQYNEFCNNKRRKLE